MGLEKGSCEDHYVSQKKAEEVIKVLKRYVKCVQQESSDKPLPLDSIEATNVTLEIDLKKVPLNRATFVNVIGPLPYSFKFETDTIDVCLIVKDPDPRKPLKDRELDLENTREIYREALIEAGFNDDFINNRLAILPMRELLTEYREYEAKSKLSKAYDVFLVDKKLMANKFSGLKKFLGTHFWKTHKKIPFPVDLSLRGQELENALTVTLASTALYVTGQGSTCSVTIGLLNQPFKDLAANLIHVLMEVNKIFGKNVSTLRVHSSNSTGNCDPIPFFVDMASPNELPDSEIAPRTRFSDKVKPAVGDLSLFDDVFVTVTGPGKFVVAEKRKPKKIDDGDSDEDEGDDNGPKEEIVEDKKDKMVERVKSNWIETTQILKKRKAAKVFKTSESVAAGRPKRRRQLIESKTG